MSDTAACVRGLTKRFGGRSVVDDLSFDLVRGRVLGLLGPNGAGKTTAIHCMLGLTQADAGEIEILGLKMPRDRRKILARVNFSSAYVSLPHNLLVRESLLVYARLYGVSKPEKKINYVLELMEIGQYKNTPAGALSSGQSSRLNLCKALLNDPELLFLDEPTAGLDPHIAVKVRTALMRIREECGTAMIHTSHNMREVELLCDETVFLSKGRVVVRGTPAEVMAKARSADLESVFIAVAETGEIAGADDPDFEQAAELLEGR